MDHRDSGDVARSPAEGQAAGPERYLSCRHIERSLVFYPGKVNACCANPMTGSTPTIAPFIDGNLSGTAVREGRAKLIERHKRGDIQPECRLCPRLTEETVDSGQSLDKYLIDEVTNRAFHDMQHTMQLLLHGARRARCHFSVIEGAAALGDIRTIDRRRRSCPYATIRFSGGEPTLLPEFEALLTLLADHSTKSIVYTNATKLSPAILSALGRDRVELILGIDAATPEVYRAIKKMDYNEIVWENVAAYCAALPAGATNKVWAKFIFTEENYKESELGKRR